MKNNKKIKNLKKIKRAICVRLTNLSTFEVSRACIYIHLLKNLFFFSLK